jgi:uncharacterized protein (DUF488 family)
MGQRILFTVGHSTRSWQDFVALLQAWRIEELVDVRTVPQSRAFPWFAKRRMQRALPKSGIEYLHLPALGGFRTSKAGDANAGWQNARFRAYADYIQTPPFDAGLQALNALRKQKRVCVMCSEAVWWRCHRRMIADAEVARGIPVDHIMSETLVKRHELTEFAVVDRRRRPPVITYPAR